MMTSEANHKINGYAAHDLKRNNWTRAQGREGRVRQVRMWLDHIHQYDDMPGIQNDNDAFTIKVLERWLAVFA